MESLEKIVLASASPRRRRMFEDLGLRFSVVPADIDEEMMPEESPGEYALRAAGEKGMAVAARLSAQGEKPWIVSADTVVVLDDEVLTKPADDMEAREMLRRLSGRTHVVITGWAVGRVGETWSAEAEETKVTFHRLTDGQIRGYVETGEGRDKAGSYAIQGLGTFLVDRIDGDYFNVVGLPISKVARRLVGLGAIAEGFMSHD